MANKRKGRFWLPNWVVDHMLPHLSRNAALVLMVLSRHANREGDAWPAVGTIATKAGLSPRTVQRCLRHICKVGLAECRTGKSGGRKSDMVLDDGTVLRGRPVVYRMFSQRWLDFQGGDKGDSADTLKGDNGDTLNPIKGDKSRPQGCQNGSARVSRVSPEGSIEGSSEGRGVVDGESIGRSVPGRGTVAQVYERIERQKAALREKQKQGVL